MQIFLSNSLTRKKELFVPLDNAQIKMYVCGPTVYDRPHLGNARAAVVYDTLFRLLREVYPEVIYARNITDVDDKIIHGAALNQVEISELTKSMTQCYHQDIQELNCLKPSFEPRATENIDYMVLMIENLLRSQNAYVSHEHVLFDTLSIASYGELSGRSIEEMLAGARIEVAPFKKNPGDFVLWKPAKPHEAKVSFESPWGKGRPGWHIECSAMSLRYLGENFDIHGGGADLMFPHHENELAQSKCANNNSFFAKYWVHNGFLTVDGEKMSKSLGNFKTVRDILDDGFSGAVIRYFYLSTHYKKPLDLNVKALIDAQKSLDKFKSLILDRQEILNRAEADCSEVLQFVADDMNTPGALAQLHKFASEAAEGDIASLHKLWLGLEFLGIKLDLSSHEDKIPEEISALAEERFKLKQLQDWAAADKIRSDIAKLGYTILDNKNSYKLEKLR